MSDVAVAARQIRYEQKAFWRNPASAGFTFAFPLMFLVIFATIFNGQPATGRNVDYVTFYIPGMAAFGVISACFTNLAIRVTLARDLGVLKRIRGTPVPGWVYLVGQLGSSIVTTVTLVAVTVGVGIVVYGVHFRTDTAGALLVALALGSVCFCALGLAISGLCPNADAAPAIVNFVIFPLVFLSSVFFPINSKGLNTLAEVFPVWHLAHAMQFTFDPHTAAPGFQGTDVLVLAAWAVGASVAALRLFRWESTRG